MIPPPRRVLLAYRRFSAYVMVVRSIRGGVEGESKSVRTDNDDFATVVCSHHYAIRRDSVC